MQSQNLKSKSFQSISLHLSLAILIFLCGSFGWSQSFQDSRKTVDSVLGILEKDPARLSDADLVFKLVKGYNVMQNDSILYYAKVMLDRSESDDYISKTEAYFEMHRYYRERSQLKKADSLNRAAFHMAKKAKDSSWMFTCEYTRTAVFFMQHQIDSASMSIEKAEALIHTVERDISKAHHYQLKALYFGMIGRPEKKLEQHLAALQIYKKENAYRFIPTAYDNIGVSYAKSGKFEEALEHFEKGLALNKKYNYRRKVLSSSMNVALVHVDMGNYDKGIPFLKELLPLATELNDSSALAMIYNNIGYAYGKLEQQDLAMKYYYRSLKMEEEMGDIEGYVYSAVNIADSYFKKGNYNSANLFLDKALPKAKGIKIHKKIQEIYHLQGQVDSANGNFKESLEHFKQASALHDSLVNARDVEKLQELQTRYETLEKEKEIENLNTLNKANELALLQNRYQNYALLGALLLALVVGFGLYSRYKIKAKLNTQLTEKNEEIKEKNQHLTEKSLELENALAEREVLIKEIHHRVKNNLQLIMSMLNLQGEHAKNKEINTFLSRSQARIASMALVHQTLYQSKSSGTIDFKKYLEELIEAIYQSFDFKTTKILYRVSCESHYLDIDRAITIGIIINELVFNSFKHAFIEKESGNLDIIVTKKENAILVEVNDNGIGMPNPMKPLKSESFGLKLTQLLVQQLEGTLNINSNTKGTAITVTIPNLNEAL